MKLYIRICLISSIIMFTVMGGYSLLFSESGEESVAVGAEPEETDIEAIIDAENRRFTASVCDAVCGNAPYLCKIAFCSVILNRCNNGAFPNTPAEVVFADGVFSEAYGISFSRVPSESSLKAYDDALKGFSPCPEALYYTTSESSDMALKTRQTLFQIGKYIFS